MESCDRGGGWGRTAQRVSGAHQAGAGHRCSIRGSGDGWLPGLKRIQTYQETRKPATAPRPLFPATPALRTDSDGVCVRVCMGAHHLLRTRDRPRPRLTPNPRDSGPLWPAVPPVLDDGRKTHYPLQAEHVSGALVCFVEHTVRREAGGGGRRTRGGGGHMLDVVGGGE